METLTNQEFTYRQTPASQDGTGTITGIYGNTLNWNQLVRNNKQTATINGVTFTNNGDNSWNISGTATANVDFNFNSGGFALDKQGIYFVSGCPSGGSSNTYSFGVGGLKNDFGNGALWKNTPNYATGYPAFLITNGVTVNFTNVKFIICNLSKMFGTEKAEEIFAMGQTDGIAYFRSLFPLPFYSYDSGSLLPFRGEGLKTVGINQWHNPIIGKSINTENGEIRVTANNNWLADKIFIGEDKNLYAYLENKDAYAGSVNIAMYGTNGYLGYTNVFQTAQVQPPQYKVVALNQDTTYIIPFGYMQGGASSITNVEMTLGNTDIDEYVPYASSTLSLPISTYFSTGMKSAGNVYDELLPNKAITRIARVDLGTLNWSTWTMSGGTVKHFYTSPNALTPSKQLGVTSPMVCSRYTMGSGDYTPTGFLDKTMIGNPSNQEIRIRDDSFGGDAAAFKNSLQGVYLYYVVATPTETEIPTPLDLTFPIDVGGTEQLLPINEEAPTTAPIICDIDYRGMIPVNATVDPTGSGTIEGLGDYRYHSIATLIAEPTDEIYRFLRWEDENEQTLSTNSEYSFQVGE